MDNEQPPLIVNESVEFSPQEFDLQHHNWTQSGAMLECSGSCPIGSPHGHIIAANQQLTRDDRGVYRLIELF